MPDLLTTEEAATYLRLSERKLYELVANAAVPCSKVTGRWLFPKAELDHWLASSISRPDGLTRPEPGSIFDVRFGLGAEAFKAKTRVREASVDGEVAEPVRYLVGLEFVRLSASDQDLLRQFLESEGRRRRSGPRPSE